MDTVNAINDKYPGTDSKSYEEARRVLKYGEEQFFINDEFIKLINIKLGSIGEKY